MTSPKVVRERQEESARNINQHRMLSAAYSFIQQNYTSLQQSVRELSIEEGFSRLKAVKIVSSKDSNTKLHVYVPSDISDDGITGILRSRLKSDREEAEKNSEKFLSAIVTPGSEKIDPGKLKEALDSDMTWIFYPETSTIKIRSDKEDIGDEFLESSASHDGTRIIDNFPHPYISGLDPLIKFSFVSLNYARIGKSPLNSVLYETSSEAYAYSVGLERDVIKADLAELLIDMDRAGLITAKGNEIYFPKNGAKFQRTFVRKYWDYVEKIGKRTLFDFENPF